MIWFYSLDQHHSSRYFRQVRFNIIMIAYHWANNFNELDRDVAYFLHCFIIAWMDYAMDPMRAKNNNFLLQEQFIGMWKASNYDVIHFTNAQLTTVAKSPADLRKRELSPKLKARLCDGIVDLMNDRRQGRMSDEDWAKYGPKLAILMTMTMDDIGHTFQAEHDREKQQRETSSNATAKKAARRAAAQNKSQGRSGDILEQVPWDLHHIRNLLAPVTAAAR